MKKKIRVEPCIRDSYLAVIRNSKGTRMFRNYVAKVNGVKRDITEDGDKSCAFFVSSVLSMFGLLPTHEVTVHRTLKTMKKSGWKEIRAPRVGCVIVWKEVENAHGILRKHIGFYIGDGKAVSNSSTRGVPVQHSYRSYKGRGILTMLWHKNLE
jgi:uncharacterized protein YycO